MKYSLLCFLLFLIFVPTFGQRLTYTYSTSEYDGEKIEADYELTFDLRDRAVIIGNGLGRPFVFQFESIATHVKTRALIAQKCGLTLVFSKDFALLYNENGPVRSWGVLPKKWRRI